VGKSKAGKKNEQGNQHSGKEEEGEMKLENTKTVGRERLRASQSARIEFVDFH